MKNVENSFVEETRDAVIKFEEKRSVVRFSNPERRMYKKVKVDGGAIRDLNSVKCDFFLCSEDERDERYVELKGSDIGHAIAQLKSTIQRIGEYDDNRHSYVSCTHVAPKISSVVQKAKIEFKKIFKSELVVKESPLNVNLY